MFSQCANPIGSLERAMFPFGPCRCDYCKKFNEPIKQEQKPPKTALDRLADYCRKKINLMENTKDSIYDRNEFTRGNYIAYYNTLHQIEMEIEKANDKQMKGDENPLLKRVRDRVYDEKTIDYKINEINNDINKTMYEDTDLTKILKGIMNLIKDMRNEKWVNSVEKDNG